MVLRCQVLRSYEDQNDKRTTMAIFIRLEFFLADIPASPTLRPSSWSKVSAAPCAPGSRYGVVSQRRRVQFCDPDDNPGDSFSCRSSKYWKLRRERVLVGVLTDNIEAARIFDLDRELRDDVCLMPFGRMPQEVDCGRRSIP